MSELLAQLDREISLLEKEIAETKRRLPAHSIKPPVMMDLLELEDKLDELLRERSRISG